MKKISLIFGLLFSFSLPLISFAFSDVSDQTTSATAINYLTTQKIINGYSDGTFRPRETVNRAEFLKMLLLARFPQNFPGQAADCFTDVGKEQWFSAYVCYAKDQKIISGYSDDSFQPEKTITIPEAAKMLVNVLGDGSTLPSGEQWYSSYLDYLGSKKYLPVSVITLTQNLSRAQVAEIIWRMLTKNSTQSSTDLNTLENPKCQSSEERVPDNINLDKVRSAWLGWYNDVRTAQGLPPYVYNPQLNRTATIWSEKAKKLGYISHKRPGQTAYYDYNIIKDWFQNLGLEFANINRVTFTENINWNYYRCSSADCTQALIDDIRSGYDFFMSEKGKAYSPHYDSIINKEFKEIGLGIAIDPVAHKYYLTVHYDTAITSNPLPICPD